MAVPPMSGGNDGASETLRVSRDADGLRALMNAPLPGAPDLFAIVPAVGGPRNSAVKRRRQCASFFPAPAMDANNMAQRLQSWLQEEVSSQLRAGSQQEIALGMVDAIPNIIVTAADVNNVALEGGEIAHPESDAAFRRHCVRKLGLQLIRPDTLLAWTLDMPDFWAEAALQEAILRKANVHVTCDDLLNAAGQMECSDRAAQTFFDARAVHGNWLVSARNLTEPEFRQCERDGPYYAWEQCNSGSAGAMDTIVPPWDGVASGADFAFRLQHAFSAREIVPALSYKTSLSNPDFPYVHFGPAEPDEALVARLSRGEWAGTLEKAWGVRVVRVTVYVWVIEPVESRGFLAFSADEKHRIPSTADCFTALGMAADMSEYFHMEVSVADVETAARSGAPSTPAVLAAWTKLKDLIRKAGGVLAIQQL